MVPPYFTSLGWGQCRVENNNFNRIMGKTIAYTLLLNVVLMDGWLKQEHLKQTKQ
jgi:hypothetical protein